MNDPASLAPTVALTMAEIGVMALLQLLIEDRITLGLDPHGGNTSRRILDIVAGWDRMARPAADGLPWSDAATPARAGLRATVERAEPMLSVFAVLAVARRQR